MSIKLFRSNAVLLRIPRNLGTWDQYYLLSSCSAAMLTPGARIRESGVFSLQTSFLKDTDGFYLP